ncbi:ferritin-like protein [Luteolibacter sp. LG18]|uniref:ferritin-like domain-containing protein n=1 Tax=Luteolibacter sp. LG18 TaxID=2819286 RepID=UPI002B2E5812|nr:hypothetical protein llg_17190 [Luteolibacter sp. LG18]
MILLKANLVRNLATGSKQAVQTALQQAVQLEHATIPPYLYTMYSLGQSEENAVVADIIGSIVAEEMLHMTLACNVLNAIGGHPVIDTPVFTPDYPGPLPGGVESGLIVNLSPFTLDVVKNVFMEIEEPQHPNDYPETATLFAANGEQGVTIGQFYDEIKKQLIALGEGAFTGDPALQVQPPFPEGSIVTDLTSALEAIDIIIDQGEGTGTTPLAGEDGELAHYYKFAEIYYGHALIPNPNAKPTDPPDQQYYYGGAPITYNASAVAQIPTNPKAADYPSGSAQRHAMDNFNYTYTSLLKGLHDLFNGQPETFRRTLGAMMSLRQQALDMMAGTNLPGPIGPSFEYQPVNPG